MNEQDRRKMIEEAIESNRKDPYAPVTLPFALSPDDWERLRAARLEGIEALREQKKSRFRIAE